MEPFHNLSGTLDGSRHGERDKLDSYKSRLWSGSRTIPIIPTISIPNRIGWFETFKPSISVEHRTKGHPSHVARWRGSWTCAWRCPPAAATDPPAPPIPSRSLFHPISVNLNIFHKTFALLLFAMSADTCVRSFGMDRFEFGKATHSPRRSARPPESVTAPCEVFRPTSR